MSSKLDLAINFFNAAETDPTKFAEICSDNLEASQNGGPPMSLETLIGFSAAVKKAVPDFHYANAVRSETESGFVEEHDVKGTLPDGSKLHLAVCVVADVANGKIIRLREYLDMSAAAGLIAALSDTR